MSSPLPEPVTDVLEVGYTDYSDSTLRVYRAAWRDFLKHVGAETDTDWKEVELPPPPRAVAAYLDNRSDLAWSTLTSRRQAIRLVYEKLGGEDPFEHPEVQEVWAKIRENAQKEPDRAQKHSLEEREHSFAEIIEEGPLLLREHLGGGPSETEEENLRYLPEKVPRLKDLSPDQRQLIPEPTYDLQVLRNRALLLLVGMADSTRSALVGIDLEDVYPPGKKGDEKAEVATRILLYNRIGEPGRVLRLESASKIKYCPHRAVAAWILAADLKEGPLFRSFTPQGEVSENRIRPQTINHVIKRCAETAGLKAENWSTKKLKRT